MSEKTNNTKLKDVITTGPTVSGLFAPSKENLIDPEPELAEENSFERCIHCGYCRHVCRVYNNTWCETDYAGGRNRIIKALDRKDIKFDKEEIIPSVFRCMLCGNCEVVCPVGVKTREVFQKFRKEVVRRGTMPKTLEVLSRSIKENNNPFLEKHGDRFNWSDSSEEGKEAYERGKKLFAAIEAGDLSKFEGERPKVGYFIGCTSSYRNKELAFATSQVLSKIGVEFIIFPDEICCGSVLFRTGLDDKAVENVKHNYAMVSKSGVKEVVFSCSGCFSTWTLEYSRVSGHKLEFDLYHLCQYVLKVVKEKNLKIRYTQRSKDDPLVITYHDPCHLGRYCGVYEEPRELLRMIEGIKTLEMKHNRDMSWCCGAGGGVKALYGDLAGMVGKNRLEETRVCIVRLSEDRLKEAVETKADTLVSSCVFCKNNLFQAATDYDSTIKVLDISQVLADCEFY